MKSSWSAASSSCTAWATSRWFEGAPRARQAPGGGDRGVFVLGFGYGRTGVMYFAPPLQAGA